MFIGLSAFSAKGTNFLIGDSGILIPLEDIEGIVYELRTQSCEIFIKI